jgi:hypothetical protein
MPDGFESLLNGPVVAAHEFEVDLNCLVTTNHKLVMEGVDRAENEEMASFEESFNEESDRDMVFSIRSAHMQFYDDLRVAARNLTLVGLITRLQHWAAAYARRIDPQRTRDGPLDENLNFLNDQLGTPPVSTDFFFKLAEVRHSVIHADAQPEWYRGKKKRGVDLKYAPNGYRVEVSDEDLREGIEKAILQIKWYDEKLTALHK